MKKIGRPAKVDKKMAKDVDVILIIIIILFALLLSVAVLQVANPSLYNYIKASAINLFK